MELIDIGVNLTSSQFRSDLAQVIEQAQASGVSKMIVTGTDLSHSHAALQLSQQYENILYSTAGIHPHHAKDYNADTNIKLLELLRSAAVVAVGECGLDFNRNYSPASEQRSCFEAQLELAVETRKPVFLHQRDAHTDFVNILKKYQPNLTRAVVHCFTGSQQELMQYLEMDLYIGITGWICDERRGKHLQSIVADIPLNRLMLETDAPYLLPRNLAEPVKSKRNEPKYLCQVCATVAKHRNIDPVLLAQTSTATALEFFAIDK